MIKAIIIIIGDEQREVVFGVRTLVPRAFLAAMNRTLPSGHPVISQAFDTQGTASQTVGHHRQCR